MALFKILKGDSSRISMEATPFHDGYAYFTPDDGGFYIDSEDNGVQKRHRINPQNAGSGSMAVDATLLASAWASGEQTVMIPGIATDSNGVVGLAQTISDAQMEAAKNADLYVCGQGNGTLTIAAFSEVPKCDIPVVVILIN